MEIRSYLSNIVRECIHDIESEMLHESIRSIVVDLLEESITEKKGGKKGESNKKGGKKNERKKNSKNSIESKVKKLMKNPDFKKAAIQYLTDDDAIDSFVDKLDGKKYSKLDNLPDATKRRMVNSKLSDEKINMAPLAYELYPSMTDAAARSYFYKKVDGVEEFTDEEVAELYTLLNNKL